jgi:hypothetical protein
MLRPAHLLPPKRLSTPHPARHHSTTNRSLLPGAPVPTKTGPTPANSIQLPGHDIHRIYIYIWKASTSRVNTPRGMPDSKVIF